MQSLFEAVGDACGDLQRGSQQQPVWMCGCVEKKAHGDGVSDHVAGVGGHHVYIYTFVTRVEGPKERVLCSWVLEGLI